MNIGSVVSEIDHLPVMADEIVAALVRPEVEVFVDATLGLGGHTRRVLELSPRIRVIGLDVDPVNLAAAENSLAEFAARITLQRANFAELEEVLHALGTPHVGGILADLGVSSNQIAGPAKGLSFDVDGPLDMRLDDRLRTTAADLVNGLSEGELADLLYFQSQESGSRRISKRICQARRHGRIQSTVQLARLVASALGQDPDARRGRIHPATRTFMALRMAVNQELDSLRQFLAQAPGVLQPGGRLAVISFHSGEDRIVKEDFRRRANEGVYQLLTKKPMTARADEKERNPRSRSAKLRVVEKRRDT
ncbi:MAG TPA: 16S rRNA (cytosine(1402)-N(4))-methyltransferase RsmH [Phycisphaerae bacterium]|nr:16S rRNA (cytosine(1402)-N(4))-methyltransferase RsmH [Phycisphaerae bacterium]